MATTRSFSNMLSEYLPNELLKEEIIKRDWLLTNIEKDNSWLGGQYVVPFVGANASSIEFGQLAAAGDISEDATVRGNENYKEVWGSMVFNHTDLMQHGALSEQNFLKILPDRVDNFMGLMKETVSMNLISGPSFALVTDATNAATGVMVVDHVDRFQIGQKVSIDDDDSAPLSVYVIAIDMSLSSVTFSATRGGAFVSLAAYTVAQNAKFYHPGAQAASFQSLIDALLSAANGGSASLHGVTKLSYPFLQAINVSGAAISATNILDKIFDAYTTVRSRARGNANTILVSYKHLGSIMKLIETQKGGFKTTATTQKASEYGWTEIELTSVKGTLKVVGIIEMPNEQIVFLDPSTLVFASNGFFKKRMSPDGIEYFEVRNTTGYQYVVDVCLFGQLIVKAPGQCGIIFGIPNY
jgi:hypothetical protein